MLRSVSANLHTSIKLLFKEVEVPKKLIVDGHKAQVQGKARVVCEEAPCVLVDLERDTPASNRAERDIGILKTKSKEDMIRANSPLVFWCYCLERRAHIENVIAKDNFLLNGMVPHSMMTGEMTEISNLCNFGWYERVKFRKPGEAYSSPTEWLGR